MNRLLREINVVIILILSICHWIIDIGRPTHSLSPVNGFAYVLVVCCTVFADAISKKSYICDGKWNYIHITKLG